MSVQPNLSRRQSRWVEKMSRFDFEVVCKAGHTNPADGLSRMHEGSEPATVAFMCSLTAWKCTATCAMTFGLQHDSTLLDEIKAAGATDPYILKHGHKFDDVNDGFFHFNGFLVVPEAALRDVVRLYHDTPPTLLV